MSKSAGTKPSKPPKSKKLPRTDGHEIYLSAVFAAGLMWLTPLALSGSKPRGMLRHS